MALKATYNSVLHHAMKNLNILQDKTNWLFDMDGTLTNAIHDFDAIRAELGLPEGKPILESIDALPVQEAKDISEKLDAMEYTIAENATEQAGAHALLTTLKEQDFNIGIVTRNGHGIAKATLKAAGLSDFFSDGDIISRDCCEPKPSPAGIQLLLKRWQSNKADAVMVGDYLFDLESGKRAGLSTIHIDVHGKFEWQELTDVGIVSLLELHALWG